MEDKQESIQSYSEQTIIINQQDKKSNSMDLVGFVLVLIGLFITWISILGWLIWIFGLTLSLVSTFKKSRELAICKYLLK